MSDTVSFLVALPIALFIVSIVLFAVVTVLFAGFLFGISVASEIRKHKSLRGYFCIPVSEEFELSWFLRQFFRLFSVKIAERWYDARVHCDKSVIVSLLCAAGVIQVVRFEFTTDSDDRVRFAIRVYVLKSVDAMFKDDQAFLRDKAIVVEKQLNDDTTTGLYQLFVCGYNVTWAYMNGSLI